MLIIYLTNHNQVYRMNVPYVIVDNHLLLILIVSVGQDCEILCNSHFQVTPPLIINRIYNSTHIDSFAYNYLLRVNDCTSKHSSIKFWCFTIFGGFFFI